jgi:hypothetical protein
MSENNVFDPMEASVAEQSSGGLPAGNYVGVFEAAEYLPAQEGDAMSGEGARKWAKIVFKWRLTEDPSNGEHKGKYALRETPQSTGVKSSYVQTCGLVMGKPLTPNDAIKLKPFVGRKYLLTVGNKTDKNGNPTNWTHVVNAMLMPQ